MVEYTPLGAAVIAGARRRSERVWVRQREVHRATLDKPIDLDLTELAQAAEAAGRTVPCVPVAATDRGGTEAGCTERATPSTEKVSTGARETKKNLPTNPR